MTLRDSLQNRFRRSALDRAFLDRVDFILPFFPIKEESELTRICDIKVMQAGWTDCPEDEKTSIVHEAQCKRSRSAPWTDSSCSILPPGIVVPARLRNATPATPANERTSPMPLNPTQIATVQGPNKRLLIWGKYRLEDYTPRYFFVHGGDTYQQAFWDNAEKRLKDDETKTARRLKLDRKTFFETLRPELRLVLDPKNPLSNIMIGDMPFYGFVLQTPAEAAASGNLSQSLPLLPDSLLLSGPRTTETTYRAIQQTGKLLFDQLCTHLRVLGSFAHPNFIRAVSELIARWVPTKANKKLGATQKIAVGLFQSKLFEKREVRRAMITFLLCLPEDETPVGSRIKTLLLDTKPGFTPGQEESQAARVLGALKEVKLALRSMEVAGDPPKWFARYGAAEFFGFKALRSKANRTEVLPEGENFAVYYRAYRDSADWVNRFCRAAPLHSFLTCYLFSLYAPHGDDDVAKAAEVGFQFGIAEATPRRLDDSYASMAKRCRRGR